MRISLRVAPGVRLSASPRGVRAGLGPRAARVHVGSGRAGVSTGVGPVSFYSSIGGSTRRSALSGAVTSTQRLSGSEKAVEAEHLRAAISSVFAIHQESFTPVTAPFAPDPVLPDFRDILKAAQKQALAPIGMTSVKRRSAARAAAYDVSCTHAAALLAEGAELKASYQRKLDDQWVKLLANDPSVVLPTLTEAFADNQVPSSAIAINGDAVSIVIVVPDFTILPERFPTTTDAGNLSVKKMTKTMRNELYLELLAGHAVVTVREAFAVAPGLGQATALLVRRGLTEPEPLVIFETSRSALGRAEGSTAVSVAVNAASALHMKTRGAAKDLQPLDLEKRADSLVFEAFLRTLRL
jgi:hypothetical protein